MDLEQIRDRRFTSWLSDNGHIIRDDEIAGFVVVVVLDVGEGTIEGCGAMRNFLGFFIQA